jgi:hypothetical protein
MHRFWNFLKAHYRAYNLLPDYLRAVKQAGWDVVWGPILPSIAYWLLWFRPNPPAWWVSTIYAVWVVMVAGYFLWRADHVRLQPAFAITRVIPQTWTDQNTGRPAKAYYFEVINKSETTSILEAEAQLSEIIPTVENLEWLPVHLVHKHDRSVPREKTFTLHPGKPKHIDLVSAFEKADRFTVLHIVSDANNQVVGKDRRRLKVTITGKDVPAFATWFDVYFDADGFFVCEMEK